MKTHIYNSTLLHILYTIFQIFKPIFRKILAIFGKVGAEKMEGSNEVKSRRAMGVNPWV